MKIDVVSNLHIETWAYEFQPMNDFDVVVAAIDVTEGTEGVELLRRLDRPVMYFPGNHEFIDA